MSEEYICKRCGTSHASTYVLGSGRCTHCGFNEFRQPDPPQPLCDFCSTPEVRWTFPCRDFRQDIPGSAVRWGSADFWAACSACYSLILRNDRTGLAMRSAKLYLRKHPEVKQIMGRNRLMQTIRKTHDNFWANREGPPVEIQEKK